MQQADAPHHHQIRHPGQWQAKDLHHASTATTKNGEKCSTATHAAAGRTRSPFPCWWPVQALLFAATVIVFPLPAHAVLATSDPACRFIDDAPEQHQVVRGDTLWDLATRFLRDPWCWPRVWEGNRDAVSNPHLIYPGQLIRLDRARGKLTSAGADDLARSLPTVRLAPSMRAESIASDPVPLLASSSIALMQRTPLMSPDELAQAPRIVALADGHRIAAIGDLIYVRSRAAGAAPLQSAELRRTLAPVVDPDDGKPIALVTRRVGKAQGLHTATDGLQAMQITEASEEIVAGDVLVSLPSARTADRRLAPHATAAMQGRVAAVLHEGRWATVHDIVALNRGLRHGLDAGSVVQVVRPVRIGLHESPQALAITSGIDEPLASLLVVDVLDHAALAVVMRAQEAFSSGAQVVSPQAARR
jgi:hypothetical protein